jgi:hypothetical protein
MITVCGIDWDVQCCSDQDLRDLLEEVAVRLALGRTDVTTDTLFAIALELHDR